MPLYVIHCDNVPFGPDWTIPNYGGYGGGIGTGLPPGAGFGGGGFGGGGYWSPPPPPLPVPRGVSWTVPLSLINALSGTQTISGVSGVQEQLVSWGLVESAFVGWPPGYFPPVMGENWGIRAAPSIIQGINNPLNGTCGDLQPGPQDLTNLPRGFGETDDLAYYGLFVDGFVGDKFVTNIPAMQSALIGGKIAAQWNARSVAGWYSLGGDTFEDIYSTTPAQVSVSKLDLLIATRYQYPPPPPPPAPPPPPIAVNPGRAYRQVCFKNTTAVAFIAGKEQPISSIVAGDPPPPQQIHICVNAAIFGNQGTGGGNTGGWNHYVYGDVAATSRLGLAFAPNGHLYLAYDIYDDPTKVTDLSQAIPVYDVLKDLSATSMDAWEGTNIMDAGVSSLFQASGFGASSESRAWKLRAV